MEIYGRRRKIGSCPDYEDFVEARSRTFHAFHSRSPLSNASGAYDSPSLAIC